MIDVTKIGYAVFYAYGFIQSERWKEWRSERSDDFPDMTNEQVEIANAEQAVNDGHDTAVALDMAELYDEWIAAEKEYFEHCRTASAIDDEGKRLQAKRIGLAKRVKETSWERMTAF